MAGRTRSCAGPWAVWGPFPRGGGGGRCVSRLRGQELLRCGRLRERGWNYCPSEDVVCLFYVLSPKENRGTLCLTSARLVSEASASAASPRPHCPVPPVAQRAGGALSTSRKLRMSSPQSVWPRQDLLSSRVDWPRGWRRVVQTSPNRNAKQT